MNKKNKLFLNFFFYTFFLIFFLFSWKLFKVEKYNASLLFFIISIFGLIILFTNEEANKNNIEFNFNNFHIINQNFFIYLIKIIIVILFVCLGQFFLFKNHKILGYISYFFSYLQILFLFKINDTTENNIKDFNQRIKKENEKKVKTFIRILIMFLFLYFVYLSLSYAQQNKYSKFLIFLILSLPLMFLLKDIFYEQIEYDNDKQIKLLDILIILVIFFVAFFIRIYKLLEIPPGYFGDDNVTLRFIFDAKNINLPIFTSTLWSATLPSKIVCFLSNLIDGVSLYSVKLINVIFGALSVIFIYLLVKEIFSKKLALITAIIYTFTFQHILLSRKIELYAMAILFIALSFYFYFLGLNKKNKILMIFSGISLGLSLYMYTACKALPLIFIFFWLMILILNFKKLNINNFILINLLIVLPSIIVFLPLFNYSINNPNVFLGRVKFVNLLPQIIKNPGVSLFNQFDIFLKLFFNENSPSGIYNLPGHSAFDNISNYFFLIGIIYLLINWKNLKYTFILIWFVFGMTMGILAATMDLYPIRILLVYPLYPLIVAIGIERIYYFFNKIDIYKINHINKVIFIIILFLIFFINLYRFFYKYPNDVSTKYVYRYEYNEMRKYLDKNKNSNVLFSFYYYTQPEVNQIDVIFNLLKIKNMPVNISISEFNKIYNNENKNVIILGEGVYDKAFNYYKEYFPDAEIYKNWNYDYYVYGERINRYDFGWKNPDSVINYIRERFYQNKLRAVVPYINFITCKIPYEDIKNLYSININYIDSNNKKINEVLYENNILINEKVNNLQITSLLEIPDYDNYEIGILNYNNAKVFIDDKLQDKNKKLYKGLHRLKIIISEAEKGNLIIYWKKANEEIKPVPMNYFINSNKIYGLLAEYKNGDEIIYKALEPIMQYNSYFYYPRYGIINKCKGNICNVVLKGYMEIKEDDYYNIILDTDREAQVFIDRKLASTKVEYGKPEVYDIHLNKGRHKIEIKSKSAQIETPTRLMMKKKNQNLFYPVLSNCVKPF